MTRLPSISPSIPRGKGKASERTEVFARIFPALVPGSREHTLTVLGHATNVTEAELIEKLCVIVRQRSELMDCIRVKAQELYQRNALGSIASNLFPDYGEFFALPPNVKDEFFELLSVFVKRDDNTFEYTGNLRKNGGILTDQSHDILHILRPHLHSSSKREVDRYLIALKPPFSRRVHELLVQDLAGRPEGKLFSWIDLGKTQIDYVDPVKLATRIQGLKVSPKSRNINGKTCIYVVNKVRVVGCVRGVA